MVANAQKMNFYLFGTSFLLLLLKTATGYSNNTATSDLYVLAYSWQPEFCYGHYSGDWPGCAAPQNYWKSYFTLHGLWPQYSTGGYPSQCTTEAFNPTSSTDKIGMSTMTQVYDNSYNYLLSYYHNHYYNYSYYY